MSGWMDRSSEWMKDGYKVKAMDERMTKMDGQMGWMDGWIVSRQIN